MLGSCKFHTGVTQTITLRDRPNLDATPLAQMLPSSGHTTGIFGRGIKRGGVRLQLDLSCQEVFKCDARHDSNQGQPELIVLSENPVIYFSGEPWPCQRNL